MTISALVSCLVLWVALLPVAPISARQLHITSQTMGVTLGIANAAYALGTVLAVESAIAAGTARGQFN